MAFLGTAVLLLVSILLMMYCVTALGKWRGKVASGIGGAVFGMEMAFLPWCILYAVTGGDSSASPFRGVSFDSPIRNMKFFVEAHAEFAREEIISGLRSAKGEEIWTRGAFLAMLLICGGISFALVYSSKEERIFGALWGSVGVGIAGDILFFVLYAIAALIYVIANNGSGVVGMVFLWACIVSLLGGGSRIIVAIIKME